MSGSKVSSLFLLFIFLSLAGCATTPSRDYQSDIDALNARVSALQGELSAKDNKISSMQGQLSQQQAVLSDSETQKRRLSEKLDATIAELEASKSRASETGARKRSDSSYLK